MTVPIRAANICEIDGPDNSYIASITGLNVGTLATTDIFVLYGSATRILRIVQVGITATANTAGAHFDVQIQGRSTAVSGGTPAVVTPSVQDPLDPASTANVCQGYTAAPVAGTSTGIFAAAKLFAPTPGSSLNVGAQFNFGYGAGCKAMILRGVNSGMAINLAGATPANPTSFDIFVVWTERDS